MDDPAGPRPNAPHERAPDPSIQGPLSVAQAAALLDQGADLMDAGEPLAALACYRRVIGNADVAVTAAGLLGSGEALDRLGDEGAAIEAWTAVVKLPRTPATYPAWRNLAAARVRSDDLRGALAAYREADKLAPPEDRAEIASRLGWLSKETGDTRGARRWFARSRGETGLTSFVTVVIGITVSVTVAAWVLPIDVLYPLLWLDKTAVADGEYWRLFTVTLVHGFPIFGFMHLFFNMYALYLAGTVVERLYGPWRFLLLYLLCAAAGSTASFVFGGDAPSVGASGAVFGMFGVLIAARAAHAPLLDRRSRALMSQLVPIVVINLAFGFFAGFVDNAAHIGGLVAGLWIGWLMIPPQGRTLASRWQRPSDRGVTSGGWAGSTGTSQDGASVGARAMPWLGVAALVVAIVAGLVVGTEARGGNGPNGILATDPGQGAGRAAASRAEGSSG
jgi:membrane associated rhomboid family serine protease